MDVQNLEKNQRNKIIKELCDQGAGFRQLARITGISYGIIQRVVTDQSPLIYLPLGSCNYLLKGGKIRLSDYIINNNWNL